MGIVMLDRRMRHVEASQRWLDLVGVTRETLLGKCHYECLPNVPAHWKANHARGLAGETIAGREESFQTPDGRTHWVNWQIVPWGDAGETTGGIVIYAEDVTERKLAAASARRHEMQYQALFENMTQGMAYCQMVSEDGVGSDFLYLAVNPHFETLTGLKNVVGKRVTQLLPEIRTLDPGLLEVYARVAQTGSSERVEWFVKSMAQWFSLSVYSPEKGFFIAIFDVITQRKQAETVARQWQHAFEKSATGIALADASANSLIEVNAAFARRLGYTPPEMAGYPVVSLVSPDEFPRVMAELSRAEAGDGHAVFETLHVRKDGSYLPVLIDSTLIRDDAGLVVSRVTFVEDLTETRKAQADLKERERTVSALLDSAAQAILAVNQEGRLVFLNRMTGRLFGYHADELIGQALDVLLPRESVAVPNGTALEGTHRNGSRFPVEIHLSLIETLQGPLTIAFVSDITERTVAEEQIRELNHQLEDRVKERTAQLEIVNRELESFSYSVSHDLRAPLRGIDGWSLALMEDYGGQFDERAAKYLSRIRSETQHMGQLIDDLLELSRLNRGEMQRTHVDLGSIAARVAAKLREAHPGRAIDFSIAQNLTAWGDARLLEIVLTNFLDNAVKFTSTRPEAHIEFGSTLRDGRSAFYIRDNGVGFEMRHADTLFGAFQRLHKRSEFPGTGIGLATVKRVIHRHGGEVWAEAELDRGATFGFTLAGNCAKFNIG
jgi:PAS domain S-box-containing protein